VGDIWNFPHAYAHSIQAKNVDTEFIVAFDKGDTGGDSSWNLQEWFRTTPKYILAKNFGFTDLSDLAGVPKSFVFAFPCKHSFWIPVCARHLTMLTFEKMLPRLRISRMTGE